MNVLVPITITPAMLTSSSIGEPATGETLWVSAGSYTQGDLRIRTTTHRVYEANITHTGRTALPEADSVYWRDVGPTALWAAFDGEISTASKAITSMSYVLRPGPFNTLIFYGLEGVGISVSLKNAPGGSVVFTYSGDILNLPLDWYDWAFGIVKARSKLLLSNITPYADPELTITITAGTGAAVGVGLIALGDLRPFIGDAEWGGTQPGATAEPINYARISTDADGTTRIRAGRAVTDMRIKVVMPRTSADYFLANVQEVLSTPVAVIATDAEGFDGLNVFGLLSGSMSYDSFGHAIFSGYVKGLV